MSAIEPSFTGSGTENRYWISRTKDYFFVTTRKSLVNHGCTFAYSAVLITNTGASVSTSQNSVAPLSTVWWVVFHMTLKLFSMSTFKHNFNFSVTSTGVRTSHKTRMTTIQNLTTDPFTLVINKGILKTQKRFYMSTGKDFLAFFATRKFCRVGAAGNRLFVTTLRDCL